MIALSCLCGAVSLSVDQRPEFLHACNCTLCGKSGARWGYFHPDAVRVEGATTSYRRQDKNDPSAELHFCPTCGCTTHFVLTQSAVAKFGNSMTGINMALADESDLTGTELRFPDGRAWNGEGAFSYVREGWILG